MGPMLLFVGGIEAGVYEVLFFIFTFILDYVVLDIMLHSNHPAPSVKEAAVFQ
jgi:hypothetical protein